MNKYYLKPEYIKQIQQNNYKIIEKNVKPNLVKRKFNTDKTNKIWVTDITYLNYNNKRMYLSTILDLYDGKVVHIKFLNLIIIN